jgi:alkylated DNA repair dioxygenase AlkB
MPSHNDGTPESEGVVHPNLVAQFMEHAERNAINIAALHAASVTQSESARVNGGLVEDVSHLLNGGCVCMSNFVCSKGDRTLFEALKSDLRSYSGEGMKCGELDGDEGGQPSRGLIDWSKHEVYENPTSISPVFNSIVAFLDAYFDVEVYASRLNYYRDGSTWKPFHHDSHAYGGKALREDFTVGISLGQNRALEFLHEPSNRKFSFPQHNGDCFAFTSDVNTRFQHGVPKSSDPSCGDRFSIIVWGRRRKITERNGGGNGANVELKKLQVETIDDALNAAYTMVGSRAASNVSEGSGTADAKKKKKKRLQ